MKSLSLPILAIAILAVCFPVIAQEGEFVSVTDAMLENPDPADWLMWRRTHNGWGFSPLDQIDRNNVNQMQLVWTRGLEEGVHEGTPLVHDGVMYIPNPADVIQAMDAATGDFKWEYRREWPDDLTDMLNAPHLNRNIAIYGDVIIDTTGDGYAIGLDARSGDLVWETLVSDYRTYPVQHSGGPIVANGKVVSGRNCGLQGPNGCVIVAHDPVTGEELWRTGTIPKPGEPGDETWGEIPYENRLHVGTWMPPDLRCGIGSRLLRDVGHFAGTEIHAGFQRQPVPLSQLDTGPRYRHRLYRVVLPARGRSLGPGPSVRAPSCGHGSVAGPGRSPVDQP